MQLDEEAEEFGRILTRSLKEGPERNSDWNCLPRKSEPHVQLDEETEEARRLLRWIHVQTEKKNHQGKRQRTGR